LLAALSAKNLPGGRTQIFNVRHIRRIKLYPIGRDVDSSLESISHTEDWLNWNGDLHNPNFNEDDGMADIESDLE